ncbi:Receptor like protein 33 [Theobroma cacao]|uniref:Receptor like protein 33 n=1 Tax=Theobroma cacao TaxID=3641 RepID=A0A061F8E3_THECC|nr:Receptor like protein 33 [Theobroma cacao]
MGSRRVGTIECVEPFLQLSDHLGAISSRKEYSNCLGNFSYALTIMNLEMNNFYGKVPNSFTNNMLRNLLLNDNQLEGLLPRSLANCSSLEVLNLRNNKLTDTFPYWLSSLPRLRVLILRSNRLHGPMPNSIASSNFSALQIIDLSHNELLGPLPTKFFQNLRAMKDAPKDGSSESFLYKNPNAQVMYAYDYHQTPVNITTKRLEIELVKTLTIFTLIDFSNNLFNGQIPEELGELIWLQALNLSNNNLTGPIPPSFGNMVALESLDLSSNKLGGRIPSQLTNLTFLEVLNLSQNDLVGPIPHGKQFNTFENDSYSGNLGLCGLPLSKQCSNPEPKPPVPMVKEDEGSEIAFIWKVVMMGYGCGVVLGLSTGYIGGFRTESNAPCLSNIWLLLYIFSSFYLKFYMENTSSAEGVGEQNGAVLVEWQKLESSSLNGVVLSSSTGTKRCVLNSALWTSGSKLGVADLGFRGPSGLANPSPERYNPSFLVWACFN